MTTSEYSEKFQHVLREMFQFDCADLDFSDTARPFDHPACGRIAVKVINHLGDEVR